MRFRGAVVSIVRLLSIVPLLAIAEIGSAVSEEQASQGQLAAKASGVVVLNGDRINLANIVDIAEGKASIEVSAEGMERIRLARGVVDHYIEKGLPAYGITTMYTASGNEALWADQHYPGGYEGR